MKKWLIVFEIAMFCLSTSASAYYTQQGMIYADDGTQVTINGLSWSGFQDTNVLQGLQSNLFYGLGAASTGRSYGIMDLLTHPYDYPKLNIPTALFKTLRIPIQPGVLYDETKTVDLHKGLTNKTYPDLGNGKFCKTWQINGNACETAVSPKEAFWTVLQEAQAQGLRVLVDIHHRYGYGDNKRDGTVYNMQQYFQDISLLANTIQEQGLTNVIGIDVFNEPYRLNWFQSQNSQVAWTKVIATAANAIYQTNPNLLVFVEGPGGGNDDKDEPIICVPSSDITEDPNGYTHFKDPSACGELDRVYFKGNWGEDFKPLLNINLAKKNIAQFDVDKFKKELIKQGITDQALQWLLGDEQANNAHIVFSPHVYPAEVGGWETAPGNASKLRFDWSWGFLHQANYPVVLGEASWKTTKGKAFFVNALMPYLAEKMSTHDVFFWAIGYLGDTVSAISPNSGECNTEVYETLKLFF